jgi:aryl-alcohol dehydrogenase-like predicted oxidoreductase
MYVSLADKIRTAAYSIEPMPYRTLGKTGLSVSMLGLGCGQILSKSDKYQEGIDLVRRAIDLGVNYFDTAPQYDESEAHLGDALYPNRQNLILASKTHDRTRDGSWRLLERTLNKLKTDYLDIWQIHHLDYDREVERIFKDDGAMQALTEAKEQGVVKYLGVTGHSDPSPLLKAINRFDFDTLLCALNPADPWNKSFLEELIPIAKQQGLGIIGMKICADGSIPKESGKIGIRSSLYYALTKGCDLAIIGHNKIEELDQNVMYTRNYSPLSERRMKEMEQMARPHHKDMLKFRDWK